MLGFSIAQVPSIPFTATVVAENSITDSSGATVTREFRTKVARDSHGRTRVDVDMNAAGSPIDLRLLQIFIYDAVSQKDITLFPFSKVAMVTQYENVSVVKQHSSSSAIPMYVEPRELSSPQKPTGKIETRREELAPEQMDGATLRHGHSMISFLAGFAGREEAYSTTTDYWYSQELQAFVLVKQVGPGKSVHTLKLEDIRKEEPARTLFEIAKEYHVDRIVQQEWHCYKYCPVP